MILGQLFRAKPFQQWDLSEKPTGDLPDIGEDSNTADDSEFKDTLQDLKDTTFQEASNG